MFLSSVLRTWEDESRCLGGGVDENMSEQKDWKVPASIVGGQRGGW